MSLTSGWKTYAVVVLAFVAQVLNWIGAIDDSTFNAFIVFLGTLGAATLRHAISAEADKPPAPKDAPVTP